MQTKQQLVAQKFNLSTAFK